MGLPKYERVELHLGGGIARASMDIGSSGWMKNVDQIAEQMEESLSLESTVVAQRASELRVEAQKVRRYTTTWFV